MEEARRKQLRFLRDIGWRLTLASVVFLAVGVAALAWKPTVATGLTVGVLLSSWAWAIAMLVVRMSGTAATMMGAEAERWSSEQLRSLEKQGWRILDAVPLNAGEGDVDHIALGPPGVFAIETKWSGSDWFDSRQRSFLARAIEAAKWRAERFRMKRTAFGLNDQPIHPVLVLWSDQISKLAEEDAIRARDGVTVVAGPWLRKWATSLGSMELTEERIAAAGSALERHQASQDDRFYGQDKSRFVRHGLLKMTDDLMLSVLAALAGLAATSLLVIWVGSSSWVSLFGPAVAVAAVSWVAWWMRHHPAMFGWAVGASGAVSMISALWLSTVVG